jgi:hypothetical protein
VFTRSGSSWSQQGPKLVGADASGAAQQGHGVALSGDGNTALLGGYADNVTAGAAFAFVRSGSTWSQLGSKLVGTGAVGAAAQGFSVALSGDGTALVGGPQDAGGNPGAAWAFELPAAPPSGGGPAGGGVGTLPLPTAAVLATISALSQTHPVFVVRPSSTPLVGRTAVRHPRGTTFSFRLNQPAVVTVRIQRKLPGRRVGRVCKPPTPRLRHRPRCTRLVTKAILRRTARVGLNKIAFTGRIRGRALAPGRYRAAFTAANTAGTSPTHALSFTIVKR